MIKNILYVEDGSVDIDDLEETLGNETKVILYRQGSTPPILVQPKEPIKDIYDDYVERTTKRLEYVKYLLVDTLNLDMPDKVRAEIEKAYNELD